MNLRKREKLSIHFQVCWKAMILLVSYWNRSRLCESRENIQESGVISSDASSGISENFSSRGGE